MVARGGGWERGRAVNLADCLNVLLRQRSKRSKAWLFFSSWDGGNPQRPCHQTLVRTGGDSGADAMQTISTQKELRFRPCIWLEMGERGEGQKSFILQEISWFLINAWSSGTCQRAPTRQSQLVVTSWPRKHVDWHDWLFANIFTVQLPQGLGKVLLNHIVCRCLARSYGMLTLTSVCPSGFLSTANIVVWGVKACHF